MGPRTPLPPHLQHLSPPEKKIPPDFPDREDPERSGNGFATPSSPKRSTPKTFELYDYPPVESRKVQPGEPLSRVNTLAYEIEELHREYRSVHAQRESLLAQHDLAVSLPTIRHLLDNKEEAYDFTAFTILYVAPDGKMTSVIPPDDQLKADPKKANNLTNRLLQQVDKVEQNFTPTKMAELSQNIRTTSRSLNRIQSDLKALEAPLPIISDKERLTWLDLLPGHSPPFTGTGKPSSGPERRFQFETLDPPGIPRARLRADAALRPSLQSSPPLPEESDGDLPPPPPMTPLAEKPEMKNVEVGTDDEVAILPFGDNLTDTDFFPEVKLETATEDLGNPDIFYSSKQSPSPSPYPYPMASVHAGGSDLRVDHGEGASEAFKAHLEAMQAEKFKNFHRTVLNNAQQRKDNCREWFVKPEELGHPTYGVSNNISICYVKKGRIKNSNKHAGTTFIHVFNPRNKTSPPNKVRENAAMIHVVLPDGKHSQYLGNKRKYLLDLENTYYDLTHALQAYNLGIRHHNQKLLDNFNQKKKELSETSKPDLLPEIQTLRVCDFHKEAYSHPKSSRAEEAHSIFKGIQRACVEIHLQQGPPLTLKRLELGDGTQQTFSSLGIKNKPEGLTQPSGKPQPQVSPLYVPEKDALGETAIPELPPVIQSTPEEGKEESFYTASEGTKALSDTPPVDTALPHYKPDLKYVCLDNELAQQILYTNTNFAKTSNKTDKSQQPGQLPVAQKTGVECNFLKRIKASSEKYVVPIKLSGCFDNEAMRNWAEQKLEYYLTYFINQLEQPNPIELSPEDVRVEYLEMINQQYDGAIVNALNHLYIDLGNSLWKNNNSSITVTINGNIWVANRGNTQTFLTDYAFDQEDTVDEVDEVDVVNVGADNTAPEVQKAMEEALKKTELDESTVPKYVNVLPAITKIPAFNLDPLSESDESGLDLLELLEYSHIFLIQMGEATGQQFTKQDVATFLRNTVGTLNEETGLINETDSNGEPLNLLNGKPFDRRDVLVSLIENPFDLSSDDESEPMASSTSCPAIPVASTLQELATTVMSENQKILMVLSENHREPLQLKTNKHHSSTIMDDREHRMELDENTVKKKLEKALEAAEVQQKNGNMKVKAIKQPFLSAKDNNEHIDKHGDTQAVVPLGVFESREIQIDYETTTLSGTGCAHSVGRRKEMQDAHISDSFIVKMGSSNVNVSITGVFDGHGGEKCAAHASKNITKHLAKRLAQFNSKGATDMGIWNALKIALVDLDREVTKLGIVEGSTANIALRINDDLWIANLGDSRAILVNQDGTVLQVSEDSDLHNEKYKQSALDRKGNIDRIYGRLRFETTTQHGSLTVIEPGSLAVSRALGDRDCPGVSARPKITKIPIKSFTGCLVQTCDGIPDVATTDDIGKAAITSYLKGDPPHSTAAKLVSMAYHAGSSDNLSAVVTHLGERQKTGGQTQRENVEPPPKDPFRPKSSSDLPTPPPQTGDEPLSSGPNVDNRDTDGNLTPPPPPPQKTGDELLSSAPNVDNRDTDGNLTQPPPPTNNTVIENLLTQSKPNPANFDYGPLHNARRAMLARILLNHHLKQNTRGASEISDDTRMWLEVVIASTVGRGCSNCNSTEFDSEGKRSEFAMKQLLSQRLTIPKATAVQITEAAAGVESTESRAKLLMDIMDDVEALESLRFDTSFDLERLKCYRQADNEDVKKNIHQACKEYAEYLQKQSCLRGFHRPCKEPPNPLDIKLHPYGNSGIKTNYEQDTITRLEKSTSIYSDCLNALPHNSQLKALFYWKGELSDKI